MNILPSDFKIVDCPKCSAHLKVASEDIEPPAEAVSFSDGFILSLFDNTYHPHFIECPVCHEGFFTGECVTKEDTRLTESYSAPLFPSPQLILDSLIKPENHQREQQIYLRKLFWYLGSHNLSGDELLINDYHFKIDWLDNLEFFEALLDEQYPEEILLKAEANRQLGRFERALELVNLAPQTDDKRLINKLRKKIKRQNTELFEVE